MPTKIVTETQIMRKLSNTPLQIEVSLLQTASHEAKNVSEQHLDTFYTTFDEIKDQRFDGMIITGAPVELLDFEDVDYWDELAKIMDVVRHERALHAATSAGARRLASTTTTAFPSTSCRRSCSECSSTRW